MDIKVGEYVRTNRGIFKIEEIKTTYVRMNGNHDKSYKLDKFKTLWFTEHNFIKHSFELTDLIEEGDYVNGEKILSISPKRDYLYAERIGFEEKDIKSIVTKEQFEMLSYKVGD